MSRDARNARARPPRAAAGRLGRPTRAWAVALALAVALLATGCASLRGYVDTEASAWGAFTQVLGGDLAAGSVSLPAPLREGHCYRVIIALEGTASPELAFQGPIDAQSVGFQIRQIERRSQPAGENLTIFGFCSQGTGTVQLVATMPSRGYGALIEAPFGSLGPSHGPDIADAQQWLVERERHLGERRARQDRERREAALGQFVESVSGELRTAMDGALAARGRYNDVVLDEGRAGVETNEALVLEPGLCYVFAALGHGSTALEVDLQFARIRNAAERHDEAGAIAYTVCTAPSGPVQEVSFRVRATVAAGVTHPPVYWVRVAHRPESSAERRAADTEWLRNDPEARVE